MSHRTQFDYVMTAKVRLLLFWVGKDDVGGGYIRFGETGDESRLEAIDLLFGSDPGKAPRKINRWGAASEVIQKDNGNGPSSGSAFFGFMKASKGASVSEMKTELSNEQEKKQFYFEAILSRVDSDGAVSRTVPFYSNEDLNLHQFDHAEALVMEKLSNAPMKMRQMDRSQKGCDGDQGFLFTLNRMMLEALSGKKAPRMVCYIYNARRYTVTLQEATPVKEKTAHYKLHGQEKETTKTYRDLMFSRFDVWNSESGEHSNFEVYFGASDPLKGVPIQFTYQPNWWFKVILNLL